MANFFKKTTNKIKGLHKSRLINPHSYWIIMVQFFLIIAFLLIVFSFYILYKIKNEQIFQVSPGLSDNPPSLIKEDFLKKVNESIEKKELKNKEIESEFFSFPDPS